jgi:hypothetical protein
MAGARADREGIMKSISMVAVALLWLGSAAHAQISPPMGDPTAPPPGEPNQIAPSGDASGVTALPAPGINGTVTEPAAPLPPGPPIVYSTPPPRQTAWRQPVGMAFLAGGGFQDFSNGALRSRTGDGGYWNVRALAGTRQIVGFEAAYVGDARSISGVGLSGNARLMSNGVEGALRLNLPLAQGPSLVEPFGFVGVGWAHYQVSGNSALSTVASSDDVLTVPFGAGLELAYRGFMADARFTYRRTYENDLLGPGGGNLNNWGVGAQIGFEY